ncbi:DUF2461 domain-containing protein [uncultured Maribacter sp.]|uniref:DUF2461 domain-containing protein n=1 Tax=uncultured Maribacter sp. TaxID=431308 RepID=UPI00262E5551|nr:DUF2461 domain-containing protein [uncultured Maribacter sp.]
MITKPVFDYLKKLEQNNNREWFTENKPEFKEHQVSVKKLAENVMQNLNKHDEIEKMKVFRIYRDVRFSKDKTPYKAHFSISFSRLGAKLRGGYYLQIKPGDSFLATGFWDPAPADLLRIRKEFELDSSEIREVIENDDFKNVWGEVVGDSVKTSPKGFDKADPNIDLIKRKQFIFIKKFTDKQVLSKNFISDIDIAYQSIRPFFDLMSSILTTNLNGESLID